MRHSHSRLAVGLVRRVPSLPLLSFIPVETPVLVGSPPTGRHWGHPGPNGYSQVTIWPREETSVAHCTPGCVPTHPFGFPTVGTQIWACWRPEEQVRRSGCPDGAHCGHDPWIGRGPILNDSERIEPLASAGYPIEGLKGVLPYLGDGCEMLS